MTRDDAMTMRQKYGSMKHINTQKRTQAPKPSQPRQSQSSQPPNRKLETGDSGSIVAEPLSSLDPHLQNWEPRLPLPANAAPKKPRNRSSNEARAEAALSSLSKMPTEEEAEEEGEEKEPNQAYDAMRFKKKGISLDKIKPLFYLRIEKAASHLGMCATLLKRICRGYGIMRWPARKVTPPPSFLSSPPALSPGSSFSLLPGVSRHHPLPSCNRKLMSMHNKYDLLSYPEFPQHPVLLLQQLNALESSIRIIKSSPDFADKHRMWCELGGAPWPGIDPNDFRLQLELRNLEQEKRTLLASLYNPTKPSQDEGPRGGQASAPPPAAATGTSLQQLVLPAASGIRRVTPFLSVGSSVAAAGSRAAAEDPASQEDSQEKVDATGEKGGGGGSQRAAAAASGQRNGKNPIISCPFLRQPKEEEEQEEELSEDMELSEHEEEAAEPSPASALPVLASAAARLTPPQRVLARTLMMSWMSRGGMPGRLPAGSRPPIRSSGEGLVSEMRILRMPPLGEEEQGAETQQEEEEEEEEQKRGPCGKEEEMYPEKEEEQQQQEEEEEQKRGPCGKEEMYPEKEEEQQQQQQEEEEEEEDFSVEEEEQQQEDDFSVEEEQQQDEDEDVAVEKEERRSTPAPAAIAPAKRAAAAAARQEERRSTGAPAAMAPASRAASRAAARQEERRSTPAPAAMAPESRAASRAARRGERSTPAPASRAASRAARQEERSTPAPAAMAPASRAASRAARQEERRSTPAPAAMAPASRAASRAARQERRSTPVPAAMASASRAASRAAVREAVAPCGDGGLRWLSKGLRAPRRRPLSPEEPWSLGRASLQEEREDAEAAAILSMVRAQPLPFHLFFSTPALRCWRLRGAVMTRILPLRHGRVLRQCRRCPRAGASQMSTRRRRKRRSRSRRSTRKTFTWRRRKMFTLTRRSKRCMLRKRRRRRGRKNGWKKREMREQALMGLPTPQRRRRRNRRGSHCLHKVGMQGQRDSELLAEMRTTADTNRSAAPHPPPPL